MPRLAMRIYRLETPCPTMSASMAAIIRELGAGQDRYDKRGSADQEAAFPFFSFQ